MDQGTESFYSSHPSAVIPNPALNWFDETKDTSARVLVSGSPVDGKVYTEIPSMNPKIFKKGYTPYFFVNAYILIIYNVVAWILSFIFKILKPLLEGFKVGAFIVKVFHHNLVILVFFLTAQEMTMMCLLQF
jgi:hypothetical protein